VSEQTSPNERTPDDLEQSEYQTTYVEQSLEGGDQNNEVLEEFLDVEDISELEGTLKSYATGPPVTGAIQYELSLDSSTDSSTHEGKIRRNREPDAYYALNRMLEASP
jgi:hypothetical protein